jgi:RIO kinase 1
MVRKSKEIWKVYKNVFDQFTERLIFKLKTQKVIDELKSPIQIGKEANVFSASTPANRDVIVKIYRLESCNFNQMFNYIKQDVRFMHLKKRRREIIFAWVQREHRNLLKARGAGVRVPTPLAYLNNIIVLEFIGDDEVAPQLKNAIPKNPEKFFKDLMSDYKKLYQDASLIHGDFSEFNILNYKEKPVMIDFSQCTPIKSPNANELLVRDIKNICRFFNKIGYETDKSEVISYIKEK